MLALESVTAGYGTAPVLDQVTLTIERGTIVAILGRNGVGKTTLLRTVMGFLGCRHGRIHLDGQEITRLQPFQRARLGIAYAPQGREIFPRLSVVENIRMGAILSPDPRERVAMVLDEFPILQAKQDARSDTLSGGQQQLLALARALATSPRILLLDEPSEGIQPSLVVQLREHIRAIHARGLTVVLVEQNLEFAAELAKQAYIMDKGQIVREIKTAEILSDADLAREYLGV